MKRLRNRLTSFLGLLNGTDGPARNVVVLAEVVQEPDVGAGVEGLRAQHEQEGGCSLFVLLVRPVGLRIFDPLHVAETPVGERGEKRQVVALELVGEPLCDGGVAGGVGCPVAHLYDWASHLCCLWRHGGGGGGVGVGGRGEEGQKQKEGGVL
jgi:hypothetical protein